MNDLDSKTITGIKWSTISQIGRQGTQFLTGIILARLLQPSDFGILGMAMVVTGFVGLFKDLGTSAAVIQQKNLSEKLLSSLFWINVLFGLAVTIALIALSPVIGAFYFNQNVVPVLQVLSFSFFITSLSIIQKALLERSLSFRPLAVIEIISSLAGSIVGIVLAFNNAGVWSLVFQTLSAVTLSTIILWFYSTWRFRFNFIGSEIKQISRFSANLVGFNVFNYFSRNSDNILIGRYLGANLLGYYSLAYNILLYSTYLITGIISRVIFPVYSLMQDDNYRLKSTYIRITRVIAFITFPLMVGEFALAKPLVLTFYGDKWLQAVPLVMIFAPIGLMQSIGATIGSIYQAKGRTDLMFKWGLFSSFFVVLGFLIGLKWGIIGVAYGYLITTSLLIFPSFYIPFRLIQLNFLHFIKCLFQPFINSMVMLAGLFLFVNGVVGRSSDIVVLISSTILGITIYSLSNWLINKKELLEFIDLLKSGMR